MGLSCVGQRKRVVGWCFSSLVKNSTFFFLIRLCIRYRVGGYCEEDEEGSIVALGPERVCSGFADVWGV